MFETVFSTLDKVQFLGRAKASGFFIRLFFVGTDHPDIDVRCVAGQFEKVCQDDIPRWTGDIMDALFAHDVTPTPDPDPTR